MKTKLLLTILLSLSTLLTHAQIHKNAPTPPMGWNSWNYFGKAAINETLIRETIDAMAASGLRDAGYQYVVVDGGWRDTVLGPNGELLVDKKKFPSGMKALSDYAHSKGLKFGLHTVPGTHDCGCDPVGGWGHEEVQFKQFLEWGVDFIKLDRCRFSLDENPQYPRNDKRWFAGWDKEGKNIEAAYTKWSQMIEKSGRPIVLSASAYRFYDWYPKLTNMGRTTGDVKSKQSGGAIFDTPSERSVMAIAMKNSASAAEAGNGYWNDPDMLVTGDQGLTLDQQRSHFALYCIMSSPLILGNDVRKMSAEEKSILLNKQAIAVNQDPTEQGKRIKADGQKEIWAKRLKNGDYAVLLLNRNAASSETITLTGKDLGLGRLKLSDISGADIQGKDSYTVLLRPHESAFLIVSK